MSKNNKKNFIPLFLGSLFLINSCAIGNGTKCHTGKTEAPAQQAREIMREKMIKATKEKIATFSEKLDKIHLGMTTNEVRNILGKPDSVDCLSEKKSDLVWNYKYPVLDYRAKFLVTFKDEKVVSYTGMLTDIHGQHYYLDHKKIVSEFEFH